MKMFNKNLIVDKNKKNLTIEKVFQEISKLLKENDYIADKGEVIKQLGVREKEMSTGIGMGIAIPHASVQELIEPKIVILRLKEPMSWEGSLDDQKVDLIISILVPTSGREDHFELLTKLSSSLAVQETIDNFRKLPKLEVVKLVDNIINEKPHKETEAELDSKNETQNEQQQIKIVGITTCPTGVAHTFMAAKAIEDEARARGWKVKIEKQGQITKDKLTAKEIEEADYVIFAIGKGVDEIERFYGKKLLEVPVARPITKAKEVLDSLITNSTVFGDKNETKVSAVESEKKSFGQGPIRHLLTGISYMIPFIAMAGIILGFTTAFGYSIGWISPDTGLVNQNFNIQPGPQWTYGFGPNTYAASAVSSIAGAGFTLFVPILGAYIAYSIAGRHAIAPAMITSFYLNDSAGTALYNYKEGHFGGFDTSVHPVALGYFGAIAAGYLIGYLVLWYTKKSEKVESQAFQTINPLLIIPIVWTLVPWVFFAFVGYLPLYWLGVGLTAAVNGLIDANIFWLVGILLGTMICFDLGGPVNKMAMTIGLLFLAQGTYFPLINGIAAVCVSIPPMVVLLTAYTGKFVGFKMDEEEKTMATSAGLMGFFGITEGSIPFAAKNPKLYIPSFMTAGAVAGGIASQTGVGNNVGFWGGPIIYLAGGMGHVQTSGPVDVSSSGDPSLFMTTNYVYALWYFVPLIIGAIVGMLMIALLNFIYNKKDKRSATNA